MNIQNIAKLEEQLQALGFENAGYSLLKRICFKPESFFLHQKMEKGKDQLSFILFFEKDTKQNAYVLMYYDAVLQKEITVPDATINGIQTSVLEKQMAEIDWKSAFDFDVKKQWSIDDKASWDKEQKVEAVVDDLLRLDSVEEGKAIATFLKIKFWAGISHQDLVGNTSFLKSRTEVSQRFYFFDGTGISVDETYRFLQSRWMVKQFQAKRKQPDNQLDGEIENAGPASSGNGLLRKKHSLKPKSVKK